MGLIASQILDEAWTHLCALPQLAYLPGRGCFEAIRIVVTRCENVRTLLRNNRYPVHRKASGLAVPAVHGGIMISLDMTKAFDMVPRHLLFDGLQHCGVSDSVQNTLKSIYQHTTFSFTHRGIHRCFPTKRGIRQGCKAAPILWSCFAGLLLGKISDALTWDWMITHILMYADDITLYEVLNNPDDVKHFLQHVGFVFDILEEHGMVINMNKTHAICRLTGSQIHRIQKTFIKRTLDGTFLVVPRHNREPTLIRIVPTIPYLGVVLSYDNFEMQTLNLRIQSGNRAQSQLHKWLHCDGQLTSHQRTKIWRQCVQSCLHYGLFAVGLTETGLHKLFSVSLKHLRRIFKEPVFVERISHLEFLERHQLPHPLVLLHELGLKHYGRAVQKLSQLDPQDVLRHIDPDHLYQTLQLIHNFLNHITTTSTSTTFTLHCSYCDKIFADHRLLRSHLTKCHEHSGGQLRQRTALDIDRGLPTCQRCKTKFTTWHNLRYHIDFVCTVPFQVDDHRLADHEHRLRVAELLNLAASTDLQALVDHPALSAYFNRCCMLCGMVCLSQRAFLLHYGIEHTSVFQQHGTILDQLHRPWHDDSPCRLCGHEFQQRHQCILIRQVAMLLTSRPDIAFDAQQTTSSQSTWPCRHCQQVYTTKRGLQMHLQRYHRALAADSSETTHPDARVHDIVAQAVLTGDCSSLLENPDVLKVLSLRCFTCQVDFTKKQYLTRHFRTHHSIDRNAVERDALILDRRHRQHVQCFCQPQNLRQHICVPFLQFIMMRRQHITAERADASGRLPALCPDLSIAADTPTDDDATSMIPEHYLPAYLPVQQNVTVVDLIALTLTFGQMDIFAMSRQLRTELTLCCQICADSFHTPDDLMAHLREDHSTDVAACDRHIRLLHWILFKDNGCICNPGVSWNTEGHHCVGLTQIAIVNSRTNHGILVPWTYKASDLVALLHTTMPLDLLVQTTLSMTARQFDQLASCESLRIFLQQKCIVCGIELIDVGFDRHFDLHRRTLGRGPELILDQFRGKDWPMLQDPDFAMHLATLLALPVWHRRHEVTGTWPTVDEVLQRQHIRDLKMSQLIVPISVLEDSNCFQIMTGLDFLDDPWMAPQLTHVCLLCQKNFFAPSNMIKHLLDSHGAFGYATKYAHDILVQIGRSRLQWHPADQGHYCVPVLNVATCLTHQHGRRFGPPGHLEKRPHSRADCGDAEAGPQQPHSDAGGSLPGLETPERPSQRSECQTPAIPGGLQDGFAHTTGASTRRHHQHVAERTSVHPAHGHGQWQHLDTCQR